MTLILTFSLREKELCQRARVRSCLPLPVGEGWVRANERAWIFVKQ